MIKHLLTLPFITLSAAALLAACAPSSVAQATGNDIASAQSIEAICQEVSEDRKQDYRALSGEVVAAGWRDDSVDDWSGKHVPKISFEAKMKKFSHAESETFLVFTNWEPVNRKSPASPYMQVGKRYGFCGRGLVPEGTNYKSGELYVVDSTETIREVKN